MNLLFISTPAGALQSWSNTMGTTRGPITTKKAAIAELVKSWRGLLDEETWTAVTASEGEMVETPPVGEEGEQQRPVDPDNHRRNRGNPKNFASRTPTKIEISNTAEILNKDTKAIKNTKTI